MSAMSCNTASYEVRVRLGLGCELSFADIAAHSLGHRTHRGNRGHVLFSRTPNSLHFKGVKNATEATLRLLPIGKVE